MLLDHTHERTEEQMLETIKSLHIEIREVEARADDAKKHNEAVSKELSELRDRNEKIIEENEKLREEGRELAVSLENDPSEFLEKVVAAEFERCRSEALAELRTMRLSLAVRKAREEIIANSDIRTIRVLIASWKSLDDVSDHEEAITEIVPNPTVENVVTYQPLDPNQY